MQVDRYHQLRVKRVVAETSDAVSLVFDVPESLRDAYRYRAGQFVTLRVDIDGEPYYRSYSMSSTPTLDADLQVTVKRVPGGVVSNWIPDTIHDGDVLDVSVPAGVFTLHDVDADDVVAFAGGSGITPVFSLIKQTLHTTSRRVRLLFANRDRSAAIFGDELDALAVQFGDRFLLQHREDVVDGFVDPAAVKALLDGCEGGSFYICGPPPFMDIVETTLLDLGLDGGRIVIERFLPTHEEPPAADGADTDSAAEAIQVTMTVRNQTKTVDQRAGATILQSARWAGLPAPSSCEAGHCATCMAMLVEGQVEMAVNDVLTDEEVAEGWVLTCQAVPVSPVVRVVYEP
ncbi:MAG: ferredoxin--NADP reductase [Actinobacteria bacterium]|nr:ferredoxin--NADP reductase [Actinomycetota bacterium]MBV9255105.1 ferredoxin--NADP reductase [Actinomycetota bacterium]